MRFLLDQGLPRSAAELLRNQNLDVVHVGEAGLASAEDAEILMRGREDRRIVVTLDADFHSLMALSGATEPSV
jgi:predicted nuclease of predicted toxin-antitoxin system